MQSIRRLQSAKAYGIKMRRGQPCPIPIVIDLFTRRRFLRWSQGVMAAIGAFPLLGESTDALAAPTPTAKSIGTAGLLRQVRRPEDHQRIRHDHQLDRLTHAAAGTGGRRTGRQTSRLSCANSRTAAGEYIAKRLRCEGALVSCGASSALSLATAACIQAANNCKPTDIPQEICSGRFPKNEVIVQKAHRYEYDHAMYLAGARSSRW